jgi:transcriptional regulator with XRE-family HTH domain
VVNRQIDITSNARTLDKRHVTLGERIEERRKRIGISQAELARRVGIRQSTMNSLIKGNSRSSRSIDEIALHLQATPRYLLGRTDDPDPDAFLAPLAPVIHHVMLPVALPSENVLARMFEGLLRTMDLSAPVDEVAHELATLLPTGLSQLRGLLPSLAEAERAPTTVASPALASDDREPPR